MTSGGFLSTIGAATLIVAAMTMPSAAQGVLQTKRLSSELANEAVAEAVAACKRMKYGVTAVVLDIGGVRQAMLRGDGATIHSLDSSHHKAYTALTYETDTIELVKRMQNVGPASLQAKLPNIALAQGGVVIKVGDDVLGAIGVGGAPGQDFDTQCARAGIDKISSRMK